MTRTNLLISLVLLAGCSQPQPPGNEGSPAAQAAEPAYNATIRWTSYGIPHIKANDWGSLGYGAGYAMARDAICVLAEEVVTVNGQRARYFGPGEDQKNVNQDIFHRALLTDAAVGRMQSSMNAQMAAMTDGYIAGYNRYLAENRENLPAACNGKAWVRPMTREDSAKVAIGVGIRYGWGAVTDEIANAAPPEAGGEKAAMTELPALTPDASRIGSNAYAIGKDLTANGRGLLLGNPHYPWKGPSRFHVSHLTIPGQLDVMGAGLITTGNFVAIGFNKDVAWSHTVSTALRFTIYELSLVDGNPLAYRFGDQQKNLEQRKVTVQVLGDDGSLTPVTKTVYVSDFGPVFESKETPWTARHAFVMRDINFENDRGAQQYYDLDRASSVDDVEKVLARDQGVSFVNTIAVDRLGNAFYGDMSAIPYVDQDLLDRCRMDLDTLRGRRVVVLDGSRPECQWKSSNHAAAPGLLPPEDLPRIKTPQYVTNSNDSYWLANPNQPLEGYSSIIGDERTPRSLRTRAGLTFIQEVIDSDTKFTRKTVQDILYSQRNYGAELLLTDILKVCDGHTGDAVAEACDVLSNWDRTQNLDSRGPQLYTELWNQIAGVDNLYAVPFDATDPVHTPRGINIADPKVKQAVVDGMTMAVAKLKDAGVPLDAPWGQVQFALRNGERIGIPGGSGFTGMFSVIYAPLSKSDHGYTPIAAGNSYIQVVTWDDDGNPDVAGMLTYSQSQQPGSPHYADQTKLYSEGKWVAFPFTEAEISKDLKETKVLTSSPEQR